MNVLIIPEHFSQDQYILKPIIQAMLEAVGKTQANVRVCQNPLLGSVDQAIRWDRINEIIDSYPQVDFFLLRIRQETTSRKRLSS